MYKKVFYVYHGFVHNFCSVEKMDNFHFDIVKGVDSHEKLQSLSLVVENFVSVKINDFGYLGEKISMLVVYVDSYNCVLQSYF